MDIPTALDQLAGGAPAGTGAGRLRAMIGADIYTAADGVHLRFRGSRDWNYLSLTLDSSDTYQMAFAHTGRAGARKNIDGVHAEQLADAFRSTTGLDTHL